LVSFCAMPSPVLDEPASYLSKARQNLAVADLARDSGHYDAAANRAYYAAFQAAVAALWVEGIRPPTDGHGTLSHLAVQSEWTGRLVYRRKLYSSDLRSTLPTLYEWRIKADYRVQSVREREARHACEQARRLVASVAARLGLSLESP
jgi:uncharacterized protein (UPF0332 family)